MWVFGVHEIRVNVVRKNFFSVLVLILTYDMIPWIKSAPVCNQFVQSVHPPGKHLVDNRRRVVFVFACCAGPELEPEPVKNPEPEPLWSLSGSASLVLPLWYQPTRVVLDKGLLNVCVCILWLVLGVSVSYCSGISVTIGWHADGTTHFLAKLLMTTMLHLMW